MRTLAIVGSHPDTRGKFDFSRTDCDVWVFNEAMNEKNGFAPRADAVFQMHQPVIWRSKVNRNDPHHYEWLSSGNTPTIYMIDDYQDVPKAEAYPIDEIIEVLFGRSNIRYFTSSVAYAIGLGIYRQYDRIEIYGVEMETDTEYVDQRPGVALLVGIAMGRGIEVQFVSDRFFSHPLYGYEGSHTISEDVYRERVTDYKYHTGDADATFKVRLDAVNYILDQYITDYKNGINGLDAAILDMAQAAHDFGVLDGRLQVNERYIAKVDQMKKESADYVIVRQEYEGAAAGGAKAKAAAIQKYNQVGIALEPVVDKLNTPVSKKIREAHVNDVKRRLAQYIKLSTEIGLTSGIVAENMTLIKILDDLQRAFGNQSAVEVAMAEMELA